jgi:hypothetical protein
MPRILELRKKRVFIFNNLAVDPVTKANRNHTILYPGSPVAFFDLSDEQLAWTVNHPWNSMVSGDIACVVSGVRDPKTISSFYIVRGISKERNQSDGSLQNVVRGDIAAKLLRDDERMQYSTILQRYITNPAAYYLNSSCQFNVGFNVANLGAELDKLNVRINKRLRELQGCSKESLSIGELKSVISQPT